MEGQQGAKLDRRTFLRGAAVAGALSFTSNSAEAQSQGCETATEAVIAFAGIPPGFAVAMKQMGLKISGDFNRVTIEMTGLKLHSAPKEWREGAAQSSLRIEMAGAAERILHINCVVNNEHERRLESMKFVVARPSGVATIEYQR